MYLCKLTFLKFSVVVIFLVFVWSSYAESSHELLDSLDDYETAEDGENSTEFLDVNLLKSKGVGSYNSPCNISFPCQSQFVCSDFHKNFSQANAEDWHGHCLCPQGSIYSLQGKDGKCWKIPKYFENNCFHDIQCHLGNWGILSRCNKDTKKCECFDTENNGNRESFLVNGKCATRKAIGGFCRNDQECKETIGGNVYCKGQQLGPIFLGKCECQDENIFYSPNHSCLSIANRLRDNCEIDDQCKQGALSSFSECFEDQCICSENAVFLEKLGTCVRKVGLNDSCDTSEICKLSLGDKADCLNSKCLLLASKYGDTCGNSQQCQKGAMGDISRCNEGKCECYSLGLEIETSYHPQSHKCYLRKQYNDSCQGTKECEASLGPEVKCGVMNKFNGTDKICYCPSGKVCRSSGYNNSGCNSSKYVSIRKLFEILIVILMLHFIAHQVAF